MLWLFISALYRKIPSLNEPISFDIIIIKCWRYYPYYDNFSTYSNIYLHILFASFLMRSIYYSSESGRRNCYLGTVDFIVTKCNNKGGLCIHDFHMKRFQYPDLFVNSKIKFCQSCRLYIETTTLKGSVDKR